MEIFTENDVFSSYCWIFHELFDRIEVGFHIKGDVYHMAALTRLTSSDELNAAIEASANKRVLIFKHSTRCPISARAFAELNSYLDGQPAEEVDYYLIYVVEDRSVSNEAAQKLGIQHESPQVMLLDNKVPVWNTSHSSITAASIRQNLS